MATVTVSSKGQMVLPSSVRARLGLGPGSQLELREEPDGIHLTLLRAVRPAEVAALAGMVKAPSRGRTRRLSSFDPAALTRRKKP